MPQTQSESSSPNRTTITVSPEVRDELFHHKEPTDTYNDVLRGLLGLE